MFPIFRVQIRNGLFIQHPFVVLKKKTFQQSAYGGNIFQHNKVHYDKSTANIILNGEKLKNFSLRSGTRVTTLATFNQHSIRSPRHSSQKRKGNKRNPIGKEEVKLSLCADVVILYTENPKDAQRTTGINKCSKIIGYKINIQKSVTFLYTNNKLSEKQIKIYRFSAIPIKIPNGIFHRTKTNDSKICMETQKTLNSQIDLQKNKSKAEDIMRPDLKLYYKATGIKTVWYQHKHRSMEQNSEPRNETTLTWPIHL